MSFPSGDASQCATIVGAVYLWAALESPLAVVLLVLVPLCMFGRVYFLCHWVLDTIVGAALGAAAVVYTDSKHGFFTVTWTNLAPIGCILVLELLGFYILKKLGFEVTQTTGNDMRVM